MYLYCFFLPEHYYDGLKKAKRSMNIRQFCDNFLNDFYGFQDGPEPGRDFRTSRSRFPEHLSFKNSRFELRNPFAHAPFSNPDRFSHLKPRN